MKKERLLLTIVAVAALAVSEPNKDGRAKTHIAEVGTDPATNYYGWATTTEGMASTPSTNDAAWKIVRTITDSNGNVIEKKNAYGSGTDENALWSTAWTNRAAATYK